MKKTKNRYDNIVLDRWDNGIDHDPRSVALFEEISRIDDDCFDGVLDLTSGGDGDIGEELMYRLDIYFDLVDNGVLNQKPSGK